MATVASKPAQSIDRIEELLGAKKDLLTYKAKVSAENLHLPGPDFIDRVVAHSDRSPQVLRSLHQMFYTGRLAGTGYMSIQRARRSRRIRRTLIRKIS